MDIFIGIYIVYYLHDFVINSIKFELRGRVGMSIQIILLFTYLYVPHATYIYNPNFRYDS